MALRTLTVPLVASSVKAPGPAVGIVRSSGWPTVCNAGESIVAIFRYLLSSASSFPAPLSTRPSSGTSRWWWWWFDRGPL